MVESVVRAGQGWSWVAAAALAAVTSSCASARLDVKRPEISLQGYVLSSAPSADASHFLGRRYDRSSGEMGDKPCPFSPISEAASNQRIAADLSRQDLASLDLGQYKLFTAGVDTRRLEGLRIELRTTKKAVVTLDRCREPVVFDAVAGNLFVEYHFNEDVALTAGSDVLRAFGVKAGGRYRVDESRKVVSETFQTNEYVAFRVNEPSFKKLWGQALFITAGVLVGGGIIADVILSRDGKDSAAEAAPLVMYIVGAGSAIGGTVLVW